MSDDKEQDDKTQDASERRLQQAIEKGDVPRSQDLASFVTLGAGAAAAAGMLSSSGGEAAGRLGGMLQRAHLGLEGRGGALALEVGRLMFDTLVLPFGAVCCAALAANMIMHPPMLVTEPLMPKFNRISPAAGAKRIFGMDNMVMFGKTLAKLALVAGVLGAILWPRRDLVTVLSGAGDLRTAASAAWQLTGRLTWAVLLLYALIAIGDAVYQRFSWKKKLKMTLHEVKEEHKETDGNPEIKARVRQIRNQRMRQRMMSAVPKATVIITNPTHYAVALKFEAGMAAPVCVAKGVDELALKIREVAGAHDIPIVENVPLARALHASVEIDEEIPAEHYKAVAEVIGFVLRLAAGARRR